MIRMMVVLASLGLFATGCAQCIQCCALGGQSSVGRGIADAPALTGRTPTKPPPEPLWRHVAPDGGTYWSENKY